MERETKEIKLSNGDKVYLVAKLKGKEYRKIQRVQLSSATIEDKMVDDKVIQAPKFDLASVADTALHFPTLCVRIVSGEKEVEPSIEYIDDLYVEDFNKITDEMENLLQVETKKA